MKYYKIIKDNTFIGVVTSDNFVRHQSKHNIFVSTTEQRGEFIDYNNKLYKGAWMRPSQYDAEGLFEMADIIEVTEEFYNEYKQAIDNHEEIHIDGDEEVRPPVRPREAYEELSIEFIRELKISDMSTLCRLTIEAGFDLELRGGTYHFSLTTQDQLNLMNLSLAAQTEELIPYHADGEECTFYTAEEINQIVAAAASFKNYHIAYYNALKTYINALETAEDIIAITYGTLIPDEYKSDVLRILE